MSSKKRHYESEDEEEDGRISSGNSEEEGEIDDGHKSRKNKKSKKSKKQFQIKFNSNYHFELGEKEKNPTNHEKLLTKYFVTNIWSNSLTYS